jgi:type IV pilus assembly protein PilO
LRAEIDRKEAALQNLSQATAGRDDPAKMVKDLEQAIKFFDSKLPQEKEIDQVLKEVWQLAEANQLQTKTIKTMKADPSAGYTEQPIQLAFSGNFYGYYAFLQQLEKLPRITRVTKMELKKMNDRDGFMEADMTLSIYFEPSGRQQVAAVQ